ncbi:RagB/SusD family nutrient uptake outer membrane protein [Adhaeribacter radiodurans]|uniref:RagB/SusD family nutrient uptake outer membrane protein n=1 Tax=Adhaeribacter radiodurans TaxID=2745197 RepID=A0A7L7L445_9BACT|nr:RagB/SusD family nutrient uptake outer membrane protein [Adhaeribacter radiodurans]QMU27550.1 RagB/SusD family nutrient uptake outer membrane protein [Adhaeribacter radiodurans]
MNSIVKKYISHSVLGISLLLFSTSCDDFLEETDQSNFTQNTYFTKPKHAESIVNAIYADLRSTTGGGFNGAPWMMLEFATGLANTDLGQAQNSINVRNLANNSDNSYGGTYWTSSFRGIANANLAIKNIPNITMDEAQKAKLLGEARFLRAYYYFNLVRIFGAIPLITEPIDLNSEALYPPKATEEETYKLIVDDLVAAEAAGLPITDKTGKVTTGAIKSLLSSVYLTMAGYPLQKGAEYYKKAADKAQEVITSNAYSLFTSYNDLHNEATENTGEHIFMVQFAPFIMASGWQTSIIPYNKGISAYSDETGAIYANTDFIQTYEPGDKRTREKEFYFNEYSLSSDRNSNINLGGYFIYKFFDPKAQLETTSSGLNWMLMRYAEVLLIYAEAANEASGGPTAEAYEAINQIRRRAELPELQGLNQQAFREATWREKWHELSYENKTWFDMVRLRKAFNVKTGNFDDYVGHQFSYGPVLKDRELLFPIPTAEIRNNKNLVQNTGY